MQFADIRTTRGLTKQAATDAAPGFLLRSLRILAVQVGFIGTDFCDTSDEQQFGKMRKILERESWDKSILILIW